MTNATLDNAFVLLCDWRGHIVWKSSQSGLAQVGDIAWSHLIPESQERAREMFSKVVALRETRTLEIENIQGRHFRAWSWPLDSPEVAVCTLGVEVPAELKELTSREQECLEMLAEGMETREIAERLKLAMSTVHTHLKAIRGKLGLTTFEALISFAARYCYPRSIPLELQVVRASAAK